MTVPEAPIKREELIDMYCETSGVKRGAPVSLTDVAVWAVRRKLFDLDPEQKIQALVRQLRKRAAAALETTPSGHTVRKYESGRYTVIDEEGRAVQQYLWAPTALAHRDHHVRRAEAARDGIAADCVRLFKHIDGVNADYLRADEKPIQLDFWSYIQDRVDRRDEDNDDGSAIESGT